MEINCSRLCALESVRALAERSCLPCGDPTSARPGDLELLARRALRMLQSLELLLDELVTLQALQFAPLAHALHVGKRSCRSTPQTFIQRLMSRYAKHGKCGVGVKGWDALLFGPTVMSRAVAIDLALLAEHKTLHVLRFA